MNCRKKKKKEKTFQKTRVRLSFFFALCSQREKQKRFFLYFFLSFSPARGPQRRPPQLRHAQGRPNRLCALVRRHYHGPVGVKPCPISRRPPITLGAAPTLGAALMPGSSAC
jgi:hypothetical protein